VVAKFLVNVVPVWLVTALGVIVVGSVVSVDERVFAMVAVLAGSLLFAFILQVVAYRSEGLVSRLSLAITGSVLLTAAAAVVFQVLSVVE
jgi:tellurite resistance protein TehA-like permease